MSGAHDAIIAAAAKSALGPQNFRRKGRSRMWIADRDWWIAVVEFQPSRWSKGTYLNVAAHFLWSGPGCISFDFGGRLAEFEAFQSETQFQAVVSRLAEMANNEAQCLCQTFNTLSEAANALLLEARSLRSQNIIRPGWPEYHAGIASALLGRTDDAEEMFASILEIPAPPPGSILHPAAKRMMRLMSDPKDFRCNVSSLIAGKRKELRLPSLDGFPFFSKHLKLND